MNRGSRLTQAIGLFGILFGLAIIVGTATGRLKTASNPELGYLIGGITAGYGLLRFLRGRMDRPNK